MKALTTSILFSAAAVASVLPRDFNAKEQVVLADCGIGTMPRPGDSSSRRLAYYAHGFKKGQTPDMAVDVPWDGSYPWRKSGVDVRLPNGDLFHVEISPDVKDWDASKAWAGYARHTYNEVEFQCWGEHGKEAFSAPDGKKCTTAYICYHDPNRAPKPNPSEEVVQANFTMSSKSANVRVQGTEKDLANWKPAKAFGHIYEATEQNQCKDDSYAIGNSCKISFDCTFGYLNTKQLSSILTDVVAPSVEKTKKKKKGRYPGKCRPMGGCEPDYEFEYYEYEYPKTGKVLVTVQPKGQPDKAKLQSFLSWNIECSDDGFCGGFCNGFGKEMVDALGGLAGVPPIGAIACSLC